MKLSEIFAQLTHGEFSQLSIGGSDKGLIQEANYAAVVAHINLGLTALYRRFPLKTGRVILRPQLGQRDYSLASKFAVTDIRSSEPVHYLIDSAFEPFRDDTLIKIDRVYDAAEKDVMLNVEGEAESCFTPANNIIRIPNTINDLPVGDLTLVYRQNHRQLVLAGDYIDPVMTEIDLPYTFLEALLYFVASRAHNPVGMQNEFHKGNSYYAKYEAVCAEIERVSLPPEVNHNNHRLYRNGFM